MGALDVKCETILWVYYNKMIRHRWLLDLGAEKTSTW